MKMSVLILKTSLRLYVLIILSSIVSILSAQTGGVSFKLKGVLLDSLTGEPESYATVSVAKRQRVSEPVAKHVTATDGSFAMSIKGAGEFVATLTSLGRRPVVRTFSSPGSGGTVDLGTMYVQDAATELGGVEIVAQKPLVKSDIDKIEYNIEDDPDSKSNMMLDMLRKVPMVTVDGEDNIKVNGSSSFKIYINGKPNSMMSKNPTEVLKGMPANTIKRIEVITDPGPKYDAEGVGGILNIITAGGGFEGYNATFSGIVGNTSAGGGVFGTVQSGKLTVSGRYNYNRNYAPAVSGGSSRHTLGEANAGSSDVVSTTGSRNLGNFQSGSFEASYEIDSLRLVTMSFGLWGGSGKFSSGGTTVALSPLDGSELYRYSSVGRGKSSWSSIDGGLDYQRMFRKKGRMLTLSYKINTNPNSSDSYSDYADASAADEWLDFLHRMTGQLNKSEGSTTEHTFQADFITPLDSVQTLETGVKYILRDNSSEDDRYQRPIGSESDHMYDADHSSHYDHRNDIIAAYLGYGVKIKRFSGRLGLRYEHTMQDVKYKLGRGDDFCENNDDVVPSASIGYKLGDAANLRLGYNLRIFRPGIWFLNPYLNDSNPTNISRGNPNLDSEKSHSFSLGFNSFTPKFNASFNLNYRFTNNSIESVSELVNDNTIEGLQNPTGKNVLFTTYRNIGKNRNVTLSTFLGWNPTVNTRLHANIYAGYTYMDDGHGMRNDGWSATISAGAQQSFANDWRASVNVFGQTPWITLQGKGSSFFNYSASLSKSFVDKRLSLTVFAADFFRKYKKNDSKIETASFRSTNWSRYEQMRFGMAVSFRIGELKASVRKTERSISNDDVKGGGQNGGE